MSVFEGMSVVLSTGDVGKVESSFGKSGKARLTFSSPLSDAAQNTSSVVVHLYMKKYLNDKSIKSYIPDIV